MLLPVTMTVLILALVTYHWTSLGLQFILMLLPVTMTVLILALVSFLITGRVWDFSLFLCYYLWPWLSWFWPWSVSLSLDESGASVYSAESSDQGTSCQTQHGLWKYKWIIVIIKQNMHSSWKWNENMNFICVHILYVNCTSSKRAKIVVRIA